MTFWSQKSPKNDDTGGGHENDQKRWRSKKMMTGGEGVENPKIVMTSYLNNPQGAIHKIRNAMGGSGEFALRKRILRYTGRWDFRFLRYEIFFVKFGVMKIFR